MQPQRDLCKCFINMSRCMQQACFYSTRRQLLLRNIRKPIASEKVAVRTDEVSRRGIQPGERLPSAVSIVSRTFSEQHKSAKNEVNTAFARYEQSMTDLAASARKMYKNARLRNGADQLSDLKKFVPFELRPYKSQEKVACPITERLNKLFFCEPSD
ncbi:uncharacterized protein LOC108097909 [Drosophila ficusphila]|uniref:uncharacterized protein LOC108097909 n=1 Tax=Drosophila ficusphila TaxID=30025 RepID=UPI0007E77B06|nr:uncharacterized protein LOC108097909 [Drosophila ficusphila]